MKIFISHSWHNKMIANKTAEVAKLSGCEVWQDAHQIQVGDNIPKAVEEGIKNTDAVVLIWSKHAAASENVLFEVSIIARLGNKPLLVCNVDDTALPEPYTAIKYIPFKDETNGMMRLRVALLMYQLKRADATGSAYGQVAVELNAMLEMVNNMIVEKDIKIRGSEGEKDYWIDQIVTTSDRVMHEFSAQLANMEETHQFMGEIKNDLELNFDDIRGLYATYEKAKNYKHANDPVYHGFLQAVENMVIERAKEMQPPAAPIQDFAWIKEYDARVNRSLVNSKAAIKKYLGWLMPDILFNPIYERVEYFFTKSAFLLEVFEELEKNYDTTGVFASTNDYLKNYIQRPDGIINDNHPIALFGITDDCWLIYTIVSDLHSHQFLNASKLDIDWDKINFTADTIFKIVGQDYRVKTETLAAEFIATIVGKQVQQSPQTQSNEQQLRELERQKQQLVEAQIMSLRSSMNGPISW